MILIPLFFACAKAPGADAAAPPQPTALPLFTSTLAPSPSEEPVPSAAPADAKPQTLELETPFLIVGQDESRMQFSCFLAGDTDASMILSSPFGGQEYPLTAEWEPVTKQYVRQTALSDLAPGTEYRYHLETPAARSAEHTFVTAPVGANFSFIFAADPQFITERQAELSTAFENGVRAVLKRNPDAAFLLSGGDQVNNPDTEEEYRLFDVNSVFAELPLAPCRGNHDASCTLFSRHFPLPNFDPATNGYFFCHGNALFAVLDSNVNDYPATDAFLSFAAKSFEADRGGRARWFIVAQHQCMFSSGDYSLNPAVVDRQNALAPIFSAHDVDLVLMGHEHMYSRSKLMQGRDPVQSDDPARLTKTRGQTLYVTLGTASGVKYYSSDSADLLPHAEIAYEYEQPQIAGVNVADNALKITAYTTDDVPYPFDEVTLEK